jgi:hypothetical protein
MNLSSNTVDIKALGENLELELQLVWNETVYLRIGARRPFNDAAVFYDVFVGADDRHRDIQAFGSNPEELIARAQPYVNSIEQQLGQPLACRLVTRTVANLTHEELVAEIRGVLRRRLQRGQTAVQPGDSFDAAAFLEAMNGLLTNPGCS